MIENEAPRKISPEQVEVISPEGEVVSGAQSGKTSAPGNPLGGQIKVFKGGPWMLLFLPLLIPLFLIGFILLIFAAFFFGKSAFKMIKMRR